RGPVNANFAVTRSAVLYVFTALAPEPIPPNEGLAWPLRIVAPEGSVVHARFPAAVAGGNVETSQRIVDVLLRALARALPARMPAASARTMNNLALGGLLGGRSFAYYETAAGGGGAGSRSAHPSWPRPTRRGQGNLQRGGRRSPAHRDAGRRRLRPPPASSLIFRRPSPCRRPAGRAAARGVPRACAAPSPRPRSRD